jgi:hypothetical protein
MEKYLKRIEESIDLSDIQKRWLLRISTVKRRFFFEKRASGREFLLIRVLKDMSYLFKWKLNILLILRAMGKIIRDEYDLSYPEQFRRMLFVLLIRREMPIFFIRYQLFREEKWANRYVFTYDQYKIQHRLADRLAPKDKAMLMDKYRFQQYCDSKGISIPPMVALFENGNRKDPAGGEWVPPECDLFMKNRRGRAGQGARKWVYKDGVYRSEDKLVLDSGQLIDFFRKSSERNGILIQQVLNAHPDWEPFTRGGLPTVRLVTGRVPNTDQIKPLLATFKMPALNPDADNMMQGSIGSAVNLETGRLEKGMSMQPVKNRFQFDYNPYTGVKITENRLPHWEELVRFAMEMHDHFRLAFVGWDITMSRNGPAVVEGNVGWGAVSTEGVSGIPLIESEYIRLFDEWVAISADEGA